MTLYVISGLGADFSVLSRIEFPDPLKVKYLPWIMPQKKESWKSYIQKMCDQIDPSEAFALLGYSFGGIIVQEIATKMPAEKVIILGSPRDHNEASALIQLGQKIRLPVLLPTSFYSEKNSERYLKLRRIITGKKYSLGGYFQVRDPYYLKWSIGQILRWRAKNSQTTIQILADRDLFFPAARAQPDFIIHNATHLFPATHAAEVSRILQEIFP